MAKTRNHKPTRLPDPKALSDLGPLLELQHKVKGKKGQLLHQWDEEDGMRLYWSPSERFLFAANESFAGPFKRVSGKSREERFDMREGIARSGALNPKETLEAAKLYAKFHARPSTGLARATISDRMKRLKYVGDGVHVIYRSDKWHQPGDDTDYIHHLPLSGSDKVSFNADWKMPGGSTHDAFASGRSPLSIFISGPRLTVNERGIIW